jgi:hypothetical protein
MKTRVTSETHRLAFGSMVALRRIEIFGEFIEFFLTKSSA